MSNLLLPFFVAVDGDGLALPGAKLWFYTTGTSTPKNTYSDADLATPHLNTNPVVADGNGLFGPIYLTSGDYKVILTTSAGSIVATRDPVAGLDGASTLTTRGDLLTRDATTYKRLPVGTPGQILMSDGVDVEWNSPAAASVVGVWQTAQGGPVTSAGLPDFLPATDADLNLGSQNITSSYPLVVSAANGFSTGGPFGRIGVSTANLTWSALTASRAAATPNFLYVTVLGDGTLTTGSTIVPPVYQWGGVPAVTNGLFTFNISEMKGYLGNGAAAPQAYMVFVGEAATDGSGVISTVAYAYNGRYDSGWTATLSNAGVSVSHNIGSEPSFFQSRYIIQNTTADGNWAVGDTFANAITNSNVTETVVPVYATRNTVGIPAIASHLVPNKTTTGNGSLTVASWKYKFTVNRGW